MVGPFVRYRMVVGVHLILLRGDHVLLGLRRDTGWRDGHYHVPAGHLERGETASAGAVREAAEELGLVLREEDLELVHTVHHFTGVDHPRIQLFFRVRNWEGEPVNAEPHLCAGLDWYRLDRLPEPMVDHTKAALELFPRGIAYSNVGWPTTRPVEPDAHPTRQPGPSTCPQAETVALNGQKARQQADGPSARIEPALRPVISLTGSGSARPGTSSIHCA